MGSNYCNHIQEVGRELPQYPTLFAKFADSLTGANDILRPAETDAFDWEAELAVVIGRPVRRATGTDAEAGRFAAECPCALLESDEYVQPVREYRAG